MQLKKALAFTIVTALISQSLALANSNSSVPAGVQALPPELFAQAAVYCKGQTGTIGMESESGKIAFVNCDTVNPANEALEKQAAAASSECPSGNCNGGKPINADQKFADILAAADKASCSNATNGELAVKCGKDLFCNIARSGGSVISAALKASPEYLVSKFTGHESLAKKFENYSNQNSCTNTSRANCAMDAVAAALFLPIMLKNGVVAAASWGANKISAGWNSVKGWMGGQQVAVDTNALTNNASVAGNSAGHQSNQQVDLAKSDPIKAAESTWTQFMIELVAQASKDQVICKRWKSDVTDWQRIEKNPAENCAERYTKDNLYCDGCDFALNAVCTSAASIAAGGWIGGAVLGAGGGAVAVTARGVGIGAMRAGSAGARTASNLVGKELAEAAARKAIQARALAHSAATRVAKTRAAKAVSETVATTAEMTGKGLVKGGQKTMKVFSVTDDVFSKYTPTMYGATKAGATWYINVGDDIMKGSWKNTMKLTLGRETLRAKPVRALVGGTAVNGAVHKLDGIAGGSDDVARNVADSGVAKADALSANQAEAPAAGAAPEAAAVPVASLSKQQLDDIAADFAEASTLIKAGTLPPGALENSVDALGECPTKDCLDLIFKTASDVNLPEPVRNAALRALNRHPNVQVGRLQGLWNKMTTAMKRTSSETLADNAMRSAEAVKAMKEGLDAAVKSVERTGRSTEDVQVLVDYYRGLYRRDKKLAASYDSVLDRINPKLRTWAKEANEYEDALTTKLTANKIDEASARPILELDHELEAKGFLRPARKKKIDDAFVACNVAK